MSFSLIDLYHQAEDYFFRNISLKCLSFAREATAYMTGVPVSSLNLLYMMKMTDTFDKILDQSEHFFKTKNLPFSVVIPQEFCGSNIAASLSGRGYQQIDKSLCMAITMDEFRSKKSNSSDLGNEIIIRANDHQLADWILPLIGAFESTVETCSIYAATHENALKTRANFQHFSLYKQDRPISSITLSVHNGLARIDDVSTLPEFQNKGYATHLMTYALLEAAKQGAHNCFLEASNAGLGVYQQLGFHSLFVNNIYSNNNY